MKTLKTTNLIFSLFILFSCENDDNNELSLKTTELKIEQISNTSISSEQKRMYSMLNKSEKLFLWNEKIKKTIKNSNFNENQIKILNDINKDLKLNLFDENSPENSYFKVVQVPKYLKELGKYFSNNQIANKFYRITPIEDTPELMSGNKDCDCNKDSMVSCTALRPENCKDSDTCDSTYNGCGFMWAYSCNGVCDPFDLVKE